MKERAEALLAQQRNNQANNCHLNTEVALEQEERPLSPASRSSDETTTTAVSKSKDRNRELATPSHFSSTTPVSQVEIPIFERIGVSELKDVDHSLSDLDERPTAAMHANDGKVEIDGCSCDDESQATTWSEPMEKDEHMPLGIGAKRPLQTMESAGGQRKISRTQENAPTSSGDTGLEEEAASKDFPILLHQDGKDSNNTTKKPKPRPDLASPVAPKKCLPPLDPLSSPEEFGSPVRAVNKRSKRPWFGKGRKRKLQQTALKFGKS
jgi:hypothetical protein